MRAELRIRERIAISETSFVELVVWKLPVPLACSEHAFKYRLALVDAGVCVLRYDNEAGKGDHKHSAGGEIGYRFRGLDGLLADFWADVERWRTRS